MTVVSESMNLPGLQIPLMKEVRIELAGPCCEPLAPGYAQSPAVPATMLSAKRFKQGHGIGPSGQWSVDLVPNEWILPAGTVYRITREPAYGQDAISCISVPASGGPFTVDELLIDPPASVQSPALTIHEQSEILHGGGQELAVAHLTVDTSTTGVTLVDVIGGSITFDAPDGPFMVDASVPIRVSGAIVVGHVQLALGSNVALASTEVTSTVALATSRMYLSVRVPTPVQSHEPVPGTEVTYKLRLARATIGAAGTVETLATGFGVPINEAYIRAYTLGQGV